MNTHIALGHIKKGTRLLRVVLPEDGIAAGLLSTVEDRRRRGIYDKSRLFISSFGIGIVKFTISCNRLGIIILKKN